MKILILCLWFIIIFNVQKSLAQQENPLKREPYKVTRISGGITFDGIPDEEVWHSIPALPMVMHTPVFGNEPSEITSMKVACDETYFFVSGFLNFKDPDYIRAIGKKRDLAVPTCDWFGIILDTFNDSKNAVMFWTNPNGVRSDGTLQNDVTDPDNDMSFSWNTFWDVKTHQDEKGWSAEFRIPFSSLKFQVSEGKTIMGLTLVRYVPAKSEFISFPAIPPDLANALWKPSLTARIEFEGLKPQKMVYLAPFVTTGIGQVNELNETSSEWKMNSTPKFDAGLDFKYSLTNNLTLDLTFNTDFAQVEADDQKINLTRYSLFFPEKRIFFLEKADIFDFSFLSGNNLFYSRKIGMYDGHPVRIYGGMRMTGRVNKWDIGILDMQTSDYQENPSENFGVIRTKRTVFNPNSYIGGMITSRLGMNGDHNLAYGLDGVVRVTGNQYLTLRWAQTFENGTDNKMADLSPSRLMINWAQRNLKGSGYEFLYSWSGDAFNPGIGFEVMDNFQMGSGKLRYGWLPEGEFLRYHKIELISNGIWNSATGRHETTNTNLSWNFEATKGFMGTAMITREIENLTDTLKLGNDQANIPPGRYPFTFFTLQYFTAYSHALTGNITAEAGSFYDGWKFSLAAAPTMNFGSDFSLDLTYNLDYLNFSGRSMKFTNHIVGLKGMMTLSTKTSLSAFIQYNTAVDKLFSNIRFRYNPAEGNDFWLVYDEEMNTRLSREMPRLPRPSSRTILLKYTYTFRL
jgi:hypothetical protein